MVYSLVYPSVSIVDCRSSKMPYNVPSAEAVPDKDREKAKHLFVDFR